MTGTAIPVSAARPLSGRRPSLRARTVAVGALDAATRARAFALFQRAYEGADQNRFEQDLAEKQFVILLHDSDSGVLQGFSTVLVRAAPELARPHGPEPLVVFSGDTVIDRSYWGQKQLQSEFTRLLVRLSLRHPRRPLYWFLISKGWRTYLLLANAFPRAVPRHDATPEDEAKLLPLLHIVAQERFGTQYDATTGIIRYAAPHERVRDGLAPLTPDLLENPHVRFFAMRNPRHGDGDELACLAEVRVIDLARVAGRIVRARIGRASPLQGLASRRGSAR